MGKDMEEIVAELKSRLRHYRDDPYCRGVWDGAMMVIAHYDPGTVPKAGENGLIPATRRAL
ncbi:hypothetical protein J2Z49_002503 [Desulfofundulus luciae]|uniref:Uncharacterized protein n=1 Tax=Desulfofundulus luciae TaxID=74702 RepID=A0ABU0B615_9FIRM|nr:hypothetical protein [Desulfofundulus luciae]MDQ0287376.1 hypothetical protein [Desulfofundulus luciae]